LKEAHILWVLSTIFLPKAPYTLSVKLS